MDGDESQEHRGEGDEEAQVLSHRLLDVGDAQKHHRGIQVHQPVEPESSRAERQTFAEAAMSTPGE